ncbi:hypothetical protein D0962_07790 [Leptolyngbyaceae cyanobacterium CCMR0082]|uniref:Uncharacterized protein n=2 Tax=Adonisia turfae TaxID=2950184 RepID=A0A6M0S474_9CYAN|nr:hypothetical protein [Adonisia turfae CCMR0081]NEZ62682.1 hypothetical protein [Adonisia turfae CCMR0082]
MPMRRRDDIDDQSRNLSPNLDESSKVNQQMEEREEFYEILKYVIIPGSIGGVGGVLLELRGIYLADSELTEVQVESTKNHWLPVLFDKPGVFSVDFLLYLLVSLILGAISGFIFTFYTIGTPSGKNRWRVVSSAMLFSLFFPTIPKFIHQSFSSQAERTYQEELVRLREKKEDITEEINESIDDLAAMDSAINDRAITRELIETYKRLIQINDESPAARMESIRDLGDLAINNSTRQPESVEQVQKILEDISQEDPDLEIREEAMLQLERIDETQHAFPLPPLPPF